jgi:hypothetical protein
MAVSTTIDALPGLPPKTTLLEFGRWLLKGGPEVDAYLRAVASRGEEEGMAIVSTMESAIELAKGSTDSVSYLRDPVAWIDRYIEFPKGGSLRPYQAECLTTLAEDHKLAIRGPHSLGKSSLAALAILHFAVTRELAGIPWKVPVTASAWRQLERFLWPEIHLWARRLRWDLLGRRPFTSTELLSIRLKMDFGEAWAQASNDPAATEGAHADHLLFVFDESRSIPVDIWDSAEGAFAGAGPDTDSEAWALALSVPGAPAGRFYDIHSRKKGYEDWKVRHVRIDEAIAAGAVSRTWVEQKRRQWTEKSAVFQQRVLGNFATSEQNTVIPLEWVEDAVDRWHAYAASGVNLGRVRSAGLDIAREGGDESCLALSTLDCVLPLARPDAPTAGALVGRVKVEMARYPGRPVVVVDADGIGAGYYDLMRQGVDWANRVFPFHAAGRATWTDYTRELTLGNMRSAAWWSLRDELDPNRPDHTPTLALPPDDLLIGDLTAPTYDGIDGGRIFIENKDEIRKRLGRSTDSGDAVAMCRVGMRWGARAAIVDATKRKPGDSAPGDLRRDPEAAGPDHGAWSPLKVSW